MQKNDPKRVIAQYATTFPSCLDRDYRVCLPQWKTEPTTHGKEWTLFLSHRSHGNSSPNSRQILLSGKSQRRPAKNSDVKDAIERMSEHLAVNGLKDAMPKLGVSLTSDGKKLTGEFAAAANQLDREHFRKGFTLPNA